MKQELLHTKFHQPAPPSKRVRRPHLLARLNEGLAAGNPLTLVSAPAGFGKTTCISEWLSGVDLPVAWLSLDVSDDEPGRFFTYFLAALHKLDPSLGSELAASLDSGYLPPVETIATTLVNDLLETPRKLILVLDDFHVIQDASILSVLEKLVASRLEQFHLLLITREDPLLPLARLRANNQLTEIRAEQLRLTPAESGAFLIDVMGLSLASADVEALDDRTEGWIAGLQLAGLSMRGRSDPAGFIATLSGTHRYILGYLTEEVLTRQSQEVQDFLLQTSILETLSGDLCDAVTGRSDSSLLLERLLAANLFLIPMDDEQQVYRYHHLFADLLRSQQGRLSKGQVAQLHQRASQWFEQAGLPGDAIQHALAAADYPAAVELLERHAMPFLSKGYAKTVEAWMQTIPAEWHPRSPKTNLAFAWMHLLRGNYARIMPYLTLVEAAINSADPAAEQTIALRAEWSALLSNLLHLQGKPAESIRLANLALASTPEDQYYLRGVAYLGLGGAYRQSGDFSQSIASFQKAIHNSRLAGHLVSEILAVTQLTLMAIQHGQLHFAAETAHQAAEWVESQGLTPPPIMGAVYGSLGLVYYEWNQVEKAREYLLRGIQLSAFSGHNASLIYSKIWLARLLQSEGNLDDAAKLTHEAAGLLPLGAPVWLKPEVVAQQVRLALAQGNLLSAETALGQYNHTSQDPFTHPDEAFFFAHLRWLLYRLENQQLPANEYDEGIQLANRLVEEAKQARRLGIALQAVLVRALLLAAEGSSAAALEDVKTALRLAEPEGCIRAFVDEGPPMESLLRRALSQSVNPGLVKSLLAAFPGATAQTPLQAGLVEPLTDRELEVLRYIAAGLKYEQIAQKLFITVNTVRYFVKEIYGKLNANNRTQAIDAARALDLL